MDIQGHRHFDAHIRWFCLDFLGGFGTMRYVSEGLEKSALYWMGILFSTNLVIDRKYIYLDAALFLFLVAYKVGVTDN